MTILYEDLHFSVYRHLIDVIDEEFSSYDFSDEAIEKLARELLPVAKDIAANYDITDDFIYTEKIDELMSELTGVVANWLEKNGIQ